MGGEAGPWKGFLPCSVRDREVLKATGQQLEKTLRSGDRGVENKSTRNVEKGAGLRKG